MRKLATLALVAVAGSAFAQTAFVNGTDVRLPGTGTGGTTTGSASLYPITWNVSGMGNATTEIFIDLEFGTLPGTTNVVLGEEHTFADDLDFMLIAPGGQQLLFMSDAGGGFNMRGRYTFRDGFAAMADSGTGQNNGTSMNNGVYGVSQYLTGDVFLAPAPGPSYTNTTFAGAFNGLNPNGTWQMYVMDDLGGDAGWLMSSTLNVSAVPEPGTIAVLGLGVAALLRRRKK